MEQKRELLFKELEVIQHEIARFDENGLRIKEWCFGIGAGLIAYGFQHDSRQIVSVAIVTTLAFALVEFTYRRYQKRFIERSGKLEEYLRSGIPDNYTYEVHRTAITSLGCCRESCAVLFRTPQFAIFYLALILVCTATLFARYPRISESFAKDRGNQSRAAREAWGAHRFGEFSIDVQKTNGNATVTVLGREGVVVSRRVFGAEEFEAVGGFSGLWIPTVQPLHNAFMIAKYGAYAGRTLLISKGGRLIELAGGLYVYDAGAHRLFLREDTDVDPLLTILDENLNVIAASRRLDEMRDESGDKLIVPDVSRFTCLPEIANSTAKAGDRAGG